MGIISGCWDRGMQDLDDTLCAHTHFTGLRRPQSERYFLCPKYLTDKFRQYSYSGSGLIPKLVLPVESWVDK